MQDKIDKVDQVRMLEVLEPDRRRTPNPARHATLEQNQAMRNSGNPTPRLGTGPNEFGVVALNMPLLDYQCLIASFPELNSNDPETHKRAWEKFFKDPASTIYRVSDSFGKQQRNTGIIVK